MVLSRIKSNLQKIAKNLTLATSLVFSANTSLIAETPCESSTSISPQDYKKYEGLEEKVNLYKKYIADAQSRYNTSFKIDLCVNTSPLFSPMSSPSDIGTFPIYDEEIKLVSFSINVPHYLLLNQSDIIFEHSSLHEVAHIIEGDVNRGYRRNPEVEIAAEHQVYKLVGEKRYKEFYNAYINYKGLTFGLENSEFIEKVKNFVPKPFEDIDNADRQAASFYLNHQDGLEHFLIYNGSIHDVSTKSLQNQVEVNFSKMEEVVKEGKPIVAFHNHYSRGNFASMYPNNLDFGQQASLEFFIAQKNPSLESEYRIIHISDDFSSISYTLSRALKKEIRQNSQDFLQNAGSLTESNNIIKRQALIQNRVINESLYDYLVHTCRSDTPIDKLDNCTVHPQYFRWPANFSIEFRGVIPKDKLETRVKR